MVLNTSLLQKVHGEIPVFCDSSNTPTCLPSGPLRTISLLLLPSLLPSANWSRNCSMGDHYMAFVEIISALPFLGNVGTMQKKNLPSLKNFGLFAVGFAFAFCFLGVWGSMAPSPVSTPYARTTTYGRIAHL